MPRSCSTADDAIIGSTLDFIITSWNPDAERMFGYSSEQIVGKSARLLTPEDRNEQAEAVMASIRNGQPVEHLETTRVRKDGTMLPVSVTISPIRDPGGMIVGASVIHRDMTDKLHGPSNARSRSEAALDPMVTISPKGRIDDVNEATATASPYV